MATEKQKRELSKLRQKVFNTAEDQKLLADLLTELIGIGDVTDISGTDLTAVPGTFADLAAVQTYLNTLVPEIETRLDNIEAKLNEIVAITD